MKLEQLYKKQINRSVNPAVSATKFDEKTIQTEIDEYVFTDEIINGLVKILDAIKNNRPFDHIGIWIDGYYGSGKSHFLKYLDYLITPETMDKAFKRLIEAINEIDPFDDRHQLAPNVDKSTVESLRNWMKKATIDTCIFNLETSYDNATDKKKAFLHVFWNEFNGKRGLNKFNISLAQHLEKPLQEKGVFEDFKKAIAEEGGDWNNPGDAADIIDNMLDWTLDIACGLAPSLSKESIRERIIRRDTVISIERFAEELKGWLKDKGENYRLILLADEVSQFINKERDRYLNLQEIITKLSEACDNKVWVACTAQQDLSEVIDECNLTNVADPEGKIRGRFEVKVSLKGTQPEVITQKRILDKKEEVREDLGELYDAKHQDFELRFKLPNSYDGYTDRDNFIDYYPFIPYQFKLIQKVFDNFLPLGYVAREVKGNERSIIKVVHATAKKRADAEVGEFISFDELYNNMFEEGLQNKGQRAIKNASDIAKKYEKDPHFAQRVVNVLFMICNIDDSEKLQFPASIDNITTLLVNDITTPWIVIRDKVENVVEYLCDNNIIRRVTGKAGSPDSFAFYSEEEMKVADLIKNQTVDNNDQSKVINEVITRYYKSLKNKEQFGTRAFSVRLIIKQRDIFGGAGSEVHLEFNTDRDYDDVHRFAFSNPDGRLVFYMGDMMQENRKLLNQFSWYCKEQKYMETPAASPENAEIRKKFKERAAEVFSKVIEPEIRKILDSCPVVSGQMVLDDPDLTMSNGDNRFRLAMKHHMEGIYTKASLVNSISIPRNTADLRAAIGRPIQPGEYEDLNAVPTEAEKEVNTYLSRQYGDVNVSDVVAKFSKPPYGWDSIPTLYVVNELVRRHLRDYAYGNDRNVDVQTVASRLVNETNKFTVREGVAISKELIHGFNEAWKYIFGPSASLGVTDSTQLFRIAAKEDNPKGLRGMISAYNKLLIDFGSYPFLRPVADVVELMEKWVKQRDPETFFKLVIDEKDKAKSMMDKVREVVQFTHDQICQFRDLVGYTKKNADNFTFLSGNPEMNSKVEMLTSLEKASWPIRIRDYVKARKAVDTALDEVRKEKRLAIDKAYNETYAELLKAASEQEVDPSVLKDVKEVIKIRCMSDNILVLQNNANTDSYFKDEAAKITAIVNKRKLEEKDKKDKEKGGGKDYGYGDDKPDEVKEPLSITLKTKRATPLGSAADVDSYLEGLRKQLMEHIDKGESVIIIS
ncbi:MAG: BREX system P-loop protein BrxC [Muribaculaceae bacterium]|nr:BREX system P-loop protein BrxC [Muribaculaceae bacterium]